MKQSDKAKAAVSAAHKGIPLPEEHKAKIIAAHLGKQHTIEHVTNVAKAQAKLSVEVAQAAKRLRQEGTKYDDIAKLFNVSRTTIHNIVEGKSLAYGEA
jgi:DNA-directed RNA polymerase specialized sigma24 family protein